MTERSGSFRIQQLDGDWVEMVADFFDQRLFDFTVLPEREKTPCPSLWRHPIQWLRWNPFLLEPEVRYEFYGARIYEARVGFNFEGGGC